MRIWIPRFVFSRISWSRALGHVLSDLRLERRHDVSGPETFSPLRARADAFPPISCSRSMGPDPTGPDSNGDVQNDASTQESFRAQTAVLSP